MAERQALSVAQKPPRSPPMAFEMTSNDALWAPSHTLTSTAPLTSPPLSQFLDFTSSECEMQAQLDKQADALRLQHQAFVAEREGWQLERDRLYRRIAALETLLKSANGHSPERSPIVSPHSGNVGAALHTKTALGISRLASIAEVESSSPCSRENRRRSPVLKRESAPARIDLSTLSTVALANGITSDVAVQSTSTEVAPDLPRSSLVSRTMLSPPPLLNRHLAGHTPLKAPRQGEISPASSSLSELLTDTPTRSNTFANESLPDGLDGDRPLKGPLNMPELPNIPGEENFTMAMLDAKLNDLIDHPEDSKPMVLQVPSPEFAAREGATVGESGEIDGTTERKTPPNTAAAESTPALGALQPEAIVAIKPDVEHGGIKLRKRPSSNFGAPLGQLGPWKA